MLYTVTEIFTVPPVGGPGRKIGILQMTGESGDTYVTNGITPDLTKIDGIRGISALVAMRLVDDSTPALRLNSDIVPVTGTFAPKIKLFSTVSASPAHTHAVEVTTAAGGGGAVTDNAGVPDTATGDNWATEASAAADNTGIEDNELANALDIEDYSFQFLIIGWE